MNKLAYLKLSMQDHHKNKYVSYISVLQNYYKYRNIKYEMYNLESVKRFKTSDTVFVIGAGPSLNLLNKEQLEIISSHNSCGINYSILKEDIIPTFQQMSYEKDWGLQHMINAVSKRKKLLKNTIFFLNDKALYRFGHPRITPYFFPEEPKCCFYKCPQPISLEKPRPFSDNDFDRTLLYRGTLTLVLDLLLKLNYKNIILLGVDPDKLSYFFEDMDEMKEYCSRLYGTFKARGINKYENMVPKGNKYNTIDVYLYALKDYLMRTKKVKMFVGFKNSMLFPEIPCYFK